MVNKVLIIGNLGKDAELKQTNSGKSVAKLTVATSENYKDNQGNWQSKTEWHTVIAWSQLAEKVGAFQKGQLVYVEGKIATRKWQDQNGNDRYSTEVTANYVRSLTKNESNQNGGNQQYSNNQTNNYQTNNQVPQQTQSTNAPYGNGGAQGGGDDLPF